MSNHHLLLILTVLLTFAAGAKATDTQKPLYGPAINNYGPYFKIEDRDTALPEDFVYKAVFDVTKTSQEPEKLNRNIESVARFINMHAANGVSTENMRIAVVLHGESTKDSLNNSAYKQRHGVENPNLPLIKELRQLGVDFYLCGQSAKFSKIEKSELSEDVELSLSAMTMLVMLQEQGYNLLP
ncbi:DsrE family protein [Kangiella sediminilitoris]|uniref:Uncharacterized protein n=1 Tax=Kangiella sediminilitoris TaxID=1144748 RepID=A0A1B3BBF0_9GAMM|nr:DsrE family protein [Kangiella sediminilitoris]AOE50107.1 hypothetical protein KS2013_1395 [Kangiella sediminilitoris]